MDTEPSCNRQARSSRRGEHVNSENYLALAVPTLTGQDIMFPHTIKTLRGLPVQQKQLQVEGAERIVGMPPPPPSKKGKCRAWRIFPNRQSDPETEGS